MKAKSEDQYKRLHYAASDKKSTHMKYKSVFSLNVDV